MAGVDLLGSGVGEICGGSLRETDIDVLTDKLGEPASLSYQWLLCKLIRGVHNKH